MGNAPEGGWREGYRADADTRPPKGAKVDTRTARITQQFREPQNLTYELDCVGVPLVVRIFFQPEDRSSSEWRIEARAGREPDVSVATATAPSRALALQAIAAGWSDTAVPAVSRIDWDGVTQAMALVRAI
jgi:hypothetical protein